MPQFTYEKLSETLCLTPCCSVIHPFFVTQSYTEFSGKNSVCNIIVSHNIKANYEFSFRHYILLINKNFKNEMLKIIKKNYENVCGKKYFSSNDFNHYLCKIIL
jgi:hypothetical protein